MVRSKWKKALVVSLTWAGLAWAQQPTPSGPAAMSGPNTGQYFTVQEAGKPGQKCKVIKSWKTPDGKTAYQVQAVATGEMMTIVENGTVRTLPASTSGSGSRIQAVATRIFHWGSDRMPPTGTPMPPVEYVQTMPSTPSPVLRPIYPTTTTTATPQPAQLPTTSPTETAKPVMVSRPWPTQTTTYAPSVPRTTDSRIAQAQMDTSSGSSSSPSPATSASPAGSTIGATTSHKPSPSTSSVNQPTTTVPDNRFSLTPFIQPKAASQSTPTSQPAVTVQNRPPATPDKTAATSVPATQSSSPYNTPTPAITTSNTSRLPQISTWPPAAPVTPQRVVQVVPPKSDTTWPAPSTTATTSAAATKNTITSGQTAPAMPSSKPAIPLTTEAKPAATAASSGRQTAYPQPLPIPTTNVPAPSKMFTSMPTPAAPAPVAQVPGSSVPAYPSSSAPTPAPALTTANPPIPKYPAPSVPPSSAWSQFNSPSTTTATPYSKGFEVPKSTSTTLWSSTEAPATKTVATTPATTPASKTVTATPATTTTITPAPPTDWRQSWGKIDSSKIATSGNTAQPVPDSKPIPPRPILPQADTKHPDPLQTPEKFNPPPEQKPTAQKNDTRLFPVAATTSSAATVKPVATPAVVASSTTTLQPVATPAAPLAKANASTTLVPVPLGAQSVIQAGAPGPGEVRYVPVPMVTIPDVRHAPAPPMTNPAQVYGTSGNVASPSGYAQANAFTPRASSPVLAQTANAFGPMGPAMPSSPSPSMLAGTGTVASGGYTVASNYPANASVITAGYQGAGLPNQMTAAAYHPTGYQGSLPISALSPVQPTPDSLHQMEITLRDSLYPSQRELAAQAMATVDWHSHPTVVQQLTKAAKEDPAATVRATCVRCLANMNVNTGPVLTVVRGLKKDSDPRVRQEAERAVSILAAGEK
jgi:hypothetical protein